MADCKIYLDCTDRVVTDRAVYVAGQLLRGTIELHLDEPKQINSLCVVVDGFACAQWAETVREENESGEGPDMGPTPKYFEGKEVYLDYKTFLLGSAGAVNVPCGVHKFDFACPLPPLIPASFEASLGFIRYSVEALLDAPFRIDKKFKIPFKVVRQDDIKEPELQLPCHIEEVKNFCHIFCRPSPLIVTVTLPKSGYLPGEAINVNINYKNNNSLEIVERTIIDLSRKVKFHSIIPEEKTKEEVEKWVEAYADGVETMQTVNFTQSLLIPAVAPPSNTKYCKIIQISYEIKIEAELSGCYSNLEIRIPVTIGDIPINAFREMMKAGIHTKLVANAAVQPEASSILPPPPPFGSTNAPLNLPPPSFEETVKMGAVKEDLDKIEEITSAAGWMPMSIPSPAAHTSSDVNFYPLAQSSKLSRKSHRNE